MDEILDIRPVFDVQIAAAAQADVNITIIDEEQPMLKEAGDTLLSRNGETWTLQIYTGGKDAKDRWRRTGGRIAAWMKAKAPKSAFVDCGPADRRELLVGILLGAYEFDKYKAPKKERPGTLFLNMDEKDFNEVRTICDAANMTREWAHEPACVINPETLSERAFAFAERYGLKCTVLDDKALTEMGAGAIVAVGQGSRTPSRMIILEYAGSGKAEKPVVLVGKSLTFDSGGYSIKPAASMMTMKYDKCGAMAVFGILRAAAELHLDTPIVGVIGAAENMLSDRSDRPDDIVRSLSGKYIEIKNTDAEGRLVLADCLTYAQQHYDPRCIIDYATLTGACLIALGKVRAGLMCTDDTLAEALFASGEKTMERVWRLPLDEEFFEGFKSSEADFSNKGDREGGTCGAGMFLKQFINDDVPWAHLDIAGTAYSEKPSVYLTPGATGYGVRLTVEWLLSGSR